MLWEGKEGISKIRKDGFCGAPSTRLVSCISDPKRRFLVLRCALLFDDAPPWKKWFLLTGGSIFPLRHSSIDHTLLSAFAKRIAL
jgi:hypothetical protein